MQILFCLIHLITQELREILNMAHLFLQDTFDKTTKKQECIPVGCVPPTAVAVPGGSPPGTPLGAGTPPPEQAPQPHPPEHAASPPVDRITDACENIALPQLRCGR